MSSSSNFKTPLPMGEGLGVRLLKQYWGYDTFRGIQEDIINSITEGRDTLGLMPTGGGKSITFQVPALAKEGLCLVHINTNQRYLLLPVEEVMPDVRVSMIVNNKEVRNDK